MHVCNEVFLFFVLFCYFHTDFGLFFIDLGRILALKDLALAAIESSGDSFEGL